MKTKTFQRGKLGNYNLDTTEFFHTRFEGLLEKIFRYLIPFLVITLFSSNAKGKEVRVGLFQKELPQEIWLSANTDFTLIDGPTGNLIIEKMAGENLSFEKTGSKILITGLPSKNTVVDWVEVELNPMRENAYFNITTHMVKERKYKGSLEIHSKPKELLVINIIDEDTYIYSVLINEMPPSWPKEALKAQAVVVRTFIRKNFGRHSKKGYDFCDITHCQVYTGIQRNYPIIREVVSETKDEVLSYKGKVIDAFYHSTCGGMTSNNEDVWTGGEPIPYLRNKLDRGGKGDYCQKSPHYEWKLEIKRKELGNVFREALEGGKKLGKFRNIEIKEKALSERAKEVILFFEGGEICLSGDKLYLVLGKFLGWHRLKSTRFWIDKTKEKYCFIGKGLGHGVGMCQWGTKGRAEEGFTYEEILFHYFPNTELKLME